MRASLCVIGCSLALLTTSTAVAAITTGTADGTLTVNGETVPLKHAYARERAGFFDSAAADISVLLTDRPVEMKALADQFALGALARAGNLRGVEVIVSREHGPISGTILDRAFQGSMSVAGVHRLELDSNGGDRFTGRLYMEGPRTFMDVTFHYRARFDAPLVRHMRPTQAADKKLEDTPQARTVLAFMKAIKDDDLEAMKKTLSAEALKELEELDPKETMEMMRAFLPEAGEISSIEVDGDTAVLQIVEKHEHGTSTATVNLVLENKTWRISP